MEKVVNKQFAQSILFPVIRRGLGISNEEVVLTEDDWDSLYKLGQKHAILPIIRQGIKGLSISADTWNKFDQACAQDMRDFILRDYLLQNIVKIFTEAKIQFVLLKGSVLRNLYPEAWMRTSCDIDVLIHETDLNRTVSLLTEKAGYQLQGRNYHDITLRNGSICLELHFSVKENLENIDFLLEKVWEFAEPSEKDGTYHLLPEYQVFYLVAHMSYHLLHGGLGIRPFMDLWLLRNKTAYDESLVCKYCSTCGIQKFYETSCELSNAWLSCTGCSDVAEQLEEYCLSGGVFGNTEMFEAGRQRKHKRTRYLLDRIFIKNSILQEIYPQLKEKPLLLPIYQIKRWLNLLNADKRKRVLKEIKQVNSIPDESIRAFDELLNNLGL